MKFIEIIKYSVPLSLFLLLSHDYSGTDNKKVISERGAAMLTLKNITLKLSEYKCQVLMELEVHVNHPVCYIH